MNSKSTIWLLALIGSGVFSYIPILWGGSLFSFSSIILGGLGAILGIYLGFKISQ